ncbi:MAG TPA: cytochrome b/b6 domain-containing protein [Hyphomonadaceae bacterium]|nr:cytochrome b/b6 domain-containing protein [Hyphomonadaceae bacterium]HPN04618.1 cytochrome b/b6 domain-containing protein [Hyphomonadaceae bacterium]
MTDITESVSHSPAPERQQRYTAVAIALHWSIALLIIGMIAVGWIMEDMAGGPGSPKTAIIQIHKSIGITILLLTIARIVWRLMNPPPPEPAMPKLQALLASSVHIFLYALMIAMPLTGWIMASAEIAQHETRFFGTVEMYVPGIAGLPAEAREGVAETMHMLHARLTWVIIGLLVLHVAGALKHQFVDKDGLLARMAPGLFGRTAGPIDKGRGGILAFGGAAAVFAIIASLSLSAPPAHTHDTVAATEETTAPKSNAPAWVVDYEKSTLKFSAAYMGRPFEGAFSGWKAQIQLDTDAPASKDTPVDGYIRVAIPLASVSTGEPYYDENVTQGDWFDVAKFPEAVFEVTGGVFKDSDTQYEATGVLTLKGAKNPVRLPFTLTLDGATATAHAETTLKRMALGVGKGTYTEEKGDAEWVADDVKVIIDLVATRQ